MKRLIAICLAALPAPLPVQSVPRPEPIEVVTVTDGASPGTASLYGNGESFITDLKVTVKFKFYAPYDIKLEDGYSPFMSVFDFGAQDKLLFCSSQTGGSGGYGNYTVYRLKKRSYELLYDDKTNSKNEKFVAVFQPDGFILINSAAASLSVSVDYMDDFYYDKIFAPDGSLKGEQPNVNDISFVSPALNPASGIYRLLTYRSVAAVAEANRLGYIVQTLDFDGNTFTPSFTEFSIGF